MSWRLPLPIDVVSQVTRYGGAVTSAPCATPSIWNCTPVTAVLSLADAVICTLPCTGAPSAGAVTVTLGAVVSGDSVVAICGSEGAEALAAASTATTV